MAQAQYGIKVPFDGDYLWATQSAGFDDIKPLLFDSLAAATSAAALRRRRGMPWSFADKTSGAVSGRFLGTTTIPAVSARTISSHSLGCLAAHEILSFP
jgi:hypothetical protein